MSLSALIGSYSERTTCPSCGDRIRLEDVRIFVKPEGPYPKCPACGTLLRVSIVYQRLILLVCFALGWLIPYLVGLRAYVVIAWIPFSFLALMLVAKLAKVTIPPKLEDAESVRHKTVLRRNFELFVSLWSFWALLILMNGVISGALEGKNVFFHYLSSPLGWFDPAFVVTRETTFLRAFGAFLANSFACALFFFPLSIIFRAAFRRSHVTQLGIYRYQKDVAEDDDDT